MMKRPREATAARASSAVNAAAARATASASARASILTAIAPPGSARRASCRRLFEMTAEFVPHGRQQLVAEVRLAARAEALVQGGGQDRDRHRLVDGRSDRPPPLAGIGHAPLEALELRVLDECGGRQVEEPRGNDAAASPHLGDVGQIEVVLVMLGIA